MDALQHYELISPILKHKKTAKQVHQETNVPPGTIHGYLKRLREGGQRIESLADKSCASHSHPNWLTDADKDMERRRAVGTKPTSDGRQIVSSLPINRGV